MRNHKAKQQARRERYLRDKFLANPWKNTRFEIHNPSLEDRMNNSEYSGPPTTQITIGISPERIHEIEARIKEQAETKDYSGPIITISPDAKTELIVW